MVATAFPPYLPRKIDATYSSDAGEYGNRYVYLKCLFILTLSIVVQLVVFLMVLTPKTIADAQDLKAFLLQCKLTLRLVELWRIRSQDETSWVDVAEAVGPVLSLDTIRIEDDRIMVNDPLGFRTNSLTKKTFRRIVFGFLDLQEGMESIFSSHMDGYSRRDRLSQRDADRDVDWKFLRPFPRGKRAQRTKIPGGYRAW